MVDILQRPCWLLAAPGRKNERGEKEDEPGQACCHVPRFQGGRL